MLKVKRSNNKAAAHAALFYFFRKIYPLIVFTISFSFFTWISFKSIHITLPSSKHPLALYSNQCGDDLKLVFLSSILSAKKSLFLVIYGLTDKDIIKALQSKASQGVDVKIFYDPSGSKNLANFFPGLSFPLKSSGLMHKKILVADHKRILLGSANLTETSLSMHDNLVLGLYHKELSTFLESSLSDAFAFSIQDQPIELWSLPEPGKLALKKVLEIIHSSKHSLKICMFTFTNKEILQALIEARNRGVEIEVAFDHYSAKGSSRSTLEALRQAGISTYTSRGGKLLHHKWCLVDGKTLILGSTNWTGAAFSKNDDCIIFLYDLKAEQKKIMKKIWDTLDLTHEI